MQHTSPFYPSETAEQSFCLSETTLPTAATAAFIARLLDEWVVLPEEWEETPAAVRQELSRLDGTEALLPKLVEHHLLTKFQADTVRRGMAAHLVLGHYRLLEPIGAGGMGAVYRAEHLHLRRQVAVKVMARTVETNPRLLHRFYGEARAVARLQHANIVACLDAGRHSRAGCPPRDYYVMELIPGADLQGTVRTNGPLTAARVCDIFRQIAEALAEAHRHGLVHRDLKPGNILVTPDWQAKLLDFGLALQPHMRMTEPGTLLGTVGYMAPEQATNPHLVDARADLFSLGATMYWALTGREPYPETGHVLQDLRSRMTAPPADVRRVRPEVPTELAELIIKLTDPDPDSRYQTARAVAVSLAGLAKWVSAAESTAVASETPGPSQAPRVLVVDDDIGTRTLIRTLLNDCDCTEVGDGKLAWAELEKRNYDLVVLDMNLPGLSGPELVTKIRSQGPANQPKIIVVSGDVPPEALGGLLMDGADDYLEKPFTPVAFRSRVRGLIGRRSCVIATPVGSSTPMPPVRDASARGRETLRLTAADMTRAATPPAVSKVPTDPLAYGTCRLLEEIGLLAPGYHDRLGRYLRALAAAAPDSGEYARLKDATYLNMLTAVAPIHDAGTLIVPTTILMKPGKLDADELSIVQQHTVIGSQVVIDVASRMTYPVPDLAVAGEVIRHHHERWDGAGYPDGLAGADIPLAARMVAVASVYEALRTRRPHRPAYSHPRAIRLITTECPGQFDPTLLTALTAAAARFDEIFHTVGRR